MEIRENIKPPTGLGPRGRRVWREVTGKYTLTPSEYELLRSMCVTTDLQSRVETRLKAAHVTSTGSAGQLVSHPLLAEHRALSETLSRLARQLNLPDLERKQPRTPKLAGRVNQIQAMKGGA